MNSDNQTAYENEAPGVALLNVLREHGIQGVRAVATFMANMGSKADIRWHFPGEIDVTGWILCDHVIQHARELEAAPVVDFDVVMTLLRAEIRKPTHLTDVHRPHLMEALRWLEVAAKRERKHRG